MRVPGSELRDRALNDRFGRADIGIADTENDDVLATLTRRSRFIVGEPGISTLTADALYEIRKLHGLNSI